MKDIVGLDDGEDLTVYDSSVSKAGNVMAIQIGDLEYANEFGVDLRFFLQSEFQFQNESFKAYVVRRLIENQVNVSTVMDTVQTLLSKYTYSVGDISNSSGGLIL